MKNLNWILLIVLAALAFASLHAGVFNFSIWKVIFNQATDRDSAIFWQIRFSRMLLVVCVGMTLGLSGAAMQGLLRNPLADSGLLGISGGAVLGAMLALYSGLAALSVWFLPAGGFLGAMLAAMLVFLFCGSRTSLLGLILAGMALNTLFFALGSLLLNFSKNPYAVLEMIYWQMGSFENRTLEQTLVAAPFMVLGWVLLLKTAPALRLLTLGEDVAKTSRVSIPKTLRLVIFGTAFSVGAAVSICGSISFIGLLIPHLMRPWVKHDPGKLLLTSGLAGSIFLLVADIFCRSITSGVELKIGVLSALLGAPFFIYLALKTKSQIT